MDTKLKDGVPSARQVCRTDFVIHLSVAFDDLKWNATTANDLFKRAQTMPASDAEAWKEAFEALLKKEIGQTDTEVLDGGPAWAVPLVLSQWTLFTKGRSTAPSAAKKYLARLKQLTADDVSLGKTRWTNSGVRNSDAAVNIILLDDYFDKEKFQRDKFKAAVGAGRSRSKPMYHSHVFRLFALCLVVGVGARRLRRVVGAGGVTGKDQAGAVEDLSRRSRAPVEPAARGDVRSRRSERSQLRAGSPGAPLVGGIQAPPRREVEHAGGCSPGRVLGEKGEKLVEDPLKRAVLQRRPLAGLQLAGR